MVRSILFRGGVVAVFGVVLAPMLMVAWLSFFAQEIATFPPDGYTVHWYANAWAHRQFSSSFVTSIELATLATLIGVPVGAAAAYAIVRARFPGKAALNALLMAPLAVPGVVLGTGLYVVFVQIDDALDFQIAATLPGLIAAHVLLTVPWTVRLVGASLAGLHPAAEEAASNLGARPWTVFRRVTLPMMRAGVVAAALFSFIQSFENLELSLLLIGPGRSTLPVEMLTYLEYRIDPTLAAVATAQIVLVGLLMLIADRFVPLSRTVA